MRRPTISVATLLTGLVLLLAGPPATAQPQAEVTSLRVVTLNTWHGFQAGKYSIHWLEKPADRQERFECQVEELQRLTPDLVLLQEVNPIPRRSTFYAERLGYEEIHRITNCGVRLGPIRIPRGVAEGLTILAKPGLALREVESLKLSGPGGCCGPNLGVQLAETRYALFGEITVSGRRILVANTHLHARAPVGSDFEPGIEELLGSRVITPEQREELVQLHSRAEARRLMETRRLLKVVERLVAKGTASGRPFESVILGGDLNSRPNSRVVAEILAFGFESLTAGRARPTLDRRAAYSGPLPAKPLSAAGPSAEV